MGGSVAMSSGTRFITASASGRQVVNSQAGDSWPCSAWPTRSLATISASALSSAITATSDGPAKTSMPTLPNSARLASATNLLPGPTITSAGLPVNRPSAMVAMACTPPRVMMTSAPARSKAYSRYGCMGPPRKGPEQAMIVCTPAALAVATPM